MRDLHHRSCLCSCFPWGHLQFAPDFGGSKIRLCAGCLYPLKNVDSRGSSRYHSEGTQALTSLRHWSTGVAPIAGISLSLFPLWMCFLRSVCFHFSGEKGLRKGRFSAGGACCESLYMANSLEVFLCFYIPYFQFLWGCVFLIEENGKFLVSLLDYPNFSVSVAACMWKFLPCCALYKYKLKDAYFLLYFILWWCVLFAVCRGLGERSILFLVSSVKTAQL